ncbi:MAG: sensor histidine kinase, partial [Candidatus Latescibacterota bacterium]
HVSGLTDSRGKTVRVEILGQNGKTAVNIHNRGEPIPPERLANFFEKFNTGPEKKHGIGLGTTYAALVVRAHGGEITVTSNAEEGTTVTVVFATQ